MHASAYVHAGMRCETQKTIGVMVSIRAFCSFCNTVKSVQKCVCLCVCVRCIKREEQILLWYCIQMILISCKRWMRDCVCSYATYIGAATFVVFITGKTLNTSIASVHTVIGLHNFFSLASFFVCVCVCSGCDPHLRCCFFFVHISRSKSLFISHS